MYSHGNEIYIAFGKYMEVALHTDTIDSLMRKFYIFGHCSHKIK